MPQQNSFTNTTRFVANQAEYFPLIVLMCVLRYYREALTVDNPSTRIQLWIPIVGQFLQFSFTSVFNRIRENGQRELHNVGLQTKRMNDFYGQGMKFSKKKEYINAADYFMMSRKIFESLDTDSIDPLLKDQYAACCYQESYARYHLHQYDRAQEIIDLAFKHPIMSDVTKTNLLNLQGLILFIDSFLLEFREDNSAEKCKLLLEASKKSFTESLKNIRKQPNVEIFLCYLHDKNEFLSNNLPLKSENVKSENDCVFHVDASDILSTLMPFLFAEACMKTGKIELAISLYNTHLACYKPLTDSDEFFEAAVVRFQCLKAYQQITEKSPNGVSVDVNKKTLTMQNEINKYLNHLIIENSIVKKMYGRACSKLKRMSGSNELIQASTSIILGDTQSMLTTQLSLNKIGFGLGIITAAAVGGV